MGHGVKWEIPTGGHKEGGVAPDWRLESQPRSYPSFKAAWEPASRYIVDIDFTNTIE